MSVSSPLIVGLGGSPRERSVSRAATAAALDIVVAQGARAAMLDLRELALPIFHPEKELDEYDAPTRVNIERLLDACGSADAMIWVSPTYHGTVSGAFKNALDFLEFLSNDTPPYLTGKPVGLIAINDNKPFGAMASCAQELRAWLAPTQVKLSKDDFDPTLRLTSADGQRRITRLVQELLGFVGFDGQPDDAAKH
jgi:FMN reductase